MSLPVEVIISARIDSGSSVENAESRNTGFSMSFSMCEERAKTGTDPVKPSELDEKLLFGRATTENFSKLSLPSRMIDKSPPRNRGGLSRSGPSRRSSQLVVIT